MLCCTGGRYVWDDPRYSGKLTVIDNESVFAGPNVTIAINKDIFRINREFIKGGDVIVLVSMQGKFCYVASENRFGFGHLNGFKAN